jgi:hypothetical protein
VTAVKWLKYELVFPQQQFISWRDYRNCCESSNRRARCGRFRLTVTPWPRRKANVALLGSSEVNFSSSADCLAGHEDVSFLILASLHVMHTQCVSKTRRDLLDRCISLLLPVLHIVSFSLYPSFCVYFLASLSRSFYFFLSIGPTPHDSVVRINSSRHVVCFATL